MQAWMWVGMLAGASSLAQAGLPVEQLVHTYSIVARDPATGELGVAVQSHYFNVGGTVPWAEAGVGAVATQAFGEASYGPWGLERLRGGQAAPDALAALLEEDPGREVRQVAMVDAQGRVAVHTGASCIAWAGHDTGAQFSVQANMMLSDAVVPAMKRAYESADGPLADRLLAALDAAEAAGGDIRGRQSAALLVVKGEPRDRPWDGRVVDLRVEDHPEPLAELRRLLRLRYAYLRMEAANAAALQGDIDGAKAAMADAERLAPGNLEIRYWHALGLAMNGRMDEAVPMLADIFAADANWAELTRRLPAAHLLTPELAEQVLAATGAAPAQ